MSTEQIVAALAEPGWCTLPDYLSANETAALRNECLAALAAGTFHCAGVGKGAATIRPEIRGDQIRWVDETNSGPAMQSVLNKLEALRLVLNQTLFLGLFDVELHFAAYPPGAGYRRHLDRFQDDDRRMLTVIFYLNENWTTEDGGQLKFWPDEQALPLEIKPTGGTLVAFFSDRFWHEVLPTNKSRISLTGWFRRR